MKFSVPATLLIVVCSAWAQQSSASTGQSNGAPNPPDRGSVNGTVTYEEGSIVMRATVYASPTDRPTVGIVPQSQTDSAGRFEIHRLSWGRYFVSAAKEDEAYPEMLSEFFTRNHEPQTITLGPDNPTATVPIRLGPKAGILTGTVIDAAISAPLNPCADFRWAADPSNFWIGSGLVKARFRVLIPSGRDVLWKVWLDGYKPWYYPGTTDKSAAWSGAAGTRAGQNGDD
jgi:hypothetical protein